MMQYSGVLRQLCLVKSDETLFLVMLLTRPFPLKNPARRTWPASASHRACVFFWLESASKSASGRQRAFWTAACVFGGQSLLKKFLRKAACVLVARVCFKKCLRKAPPGRKFRPTAHVGWHADSEGSRGVAERREVAFSLRLLAEKLIPRFENIVL